MCPVSTGAARIFQRGGGQIEGAKRPSRGRVWESPPPYHDRRIFGISCIKISLFCKLNVIIRGRLCEVAYTNSLLPLFFNFFESALSPIKGGGGMGPCALSYGSASDVARICQRGVKARERSDRVGRGCGRGVLPPTVGRFLKFRVSKWPFSAH